MNAEEIPEIFVINPCLEKCAHPINRSEILRFFSSFSGDFLSVSNIRRNQLVEVVQSSEIDD